MCKLFLKECDDDSGECQYIIKEKNLSILCFSSLPCNDNNVFLSSFLSDNILRMDKKNYFVEKLEGNYSYHLGCKVINKDEGIVVLHSIKILLDNPLPGDISNNDFIEFNVQRLDISTKK